MSEEDDYNPQDDIVIPSSNVAVNSNGKLSRRKRKRQALEASSTAPSKDDTSKRQRMSDDEDGDEINREKSAIDEDVESGGVSLHATQQTEDDVPSQNEKTKRKNNQKSSDNKKEEEGPSLNESIAHMDQGLMADYISQRIRKFQKDLSFVELGDQLLPQKYFVDTSTFKHSRSLLNMPQYMEIFCTKKGQSTISHLKSSPKNPGSPHTIVIAAAALRAADIVRALRGYQTKDSAVAKFFAKHIKLKESIEYAKETRLGIAVGTPARLVDLVKEGALQPKYLQRVILDASYVDQKKRGMFDMKEVQEKVMELLAIEGIRKRLDGGDEDSGDRRGVLFY